MEKYDIAWLQSLIHQRLGVFHSKVLLIRVLDAMAARGEIRPMKKWYFKHGTIDERVKKLLAHLPTAQGHDDLKPYTETVTHRGDTAVPMDEVQGRIAKAYKEINHPINPFDDADQAIAEILAPLSEDIEAAHQEYSSGGVLQPDAFVRFEENTPDSPDTP